MKVDMPRDQIAAFCEKWRVKQLAVFGSVLRDDFRPDSDIDMLYALRDDASWSLFEHARAEDELAAILGRKVDLVSRNALRNPFRRHHILTRHMVVYDA